MSALVGLLLVFLLAALLKGVTGWPLLLMIVCCALAAALDDAGRLR